MIMYTVKGLKDGVKRRFVQTLPETIDTDPKDVGEGYVPGLLEVVPGVWHPRVINSSRLEKAEKEKKAGLAEVTPDVS